MASRARNILGFLFIVLSNACSSNFKIESTPPDAEVFVENFKTGDKKSLGKTPINMDMGKLTEMLGSTSVGAGNYFHLDVEKNGFISQRLAVPASKFGTLVMELEVNLKAGEQAKQAKLAEDILNHFFLAQKFAMNKEFDRAQAEVDRILEAFPDFARAQSMRGSIYYVQKNYPEALKWYELALKSDPKMEEAVKMIAKINGEKGGTRSAAPVKGKR